MRISERSISAIADVITGDQGLSRYRSGPKLVRLFNDHGSDDVYGQRFPSRGTYTEERLRNLNGTGVLAELLREVLHPTEFLDIDAEQAGAIEHINARLKFDGYEISIDNAGLPVVKTVRGSLVEFAHAGARAEEDARGFLDEQLAKCDHKLREGDYDGAVTNARSLTEAVLLDIERELGPAHRDYDGDLLRLFKRVQKLLELDPARPDVETTLKQVLSGLTSIVAGLGGTSNKMGDRHARSYRPAKRHALLIVDSAKTLANFLIGTLEARRAESAPKAPATTRDSAATPDGRVGAKRETK